MTNITTITPDQPGHEKAVRGKYAALYRHLSAHPGSEWPATFGDVEQILGFRLPGSARRHSAWWSNGTGGHSHALSWHAAGWRTRAVNIAAETLMFVRGEDASEPPGMPAGQIHETLQPGRSFPRRTPNPEPIREDTGRSTRRPGRAPVTVADQTLEAKRRVEDGLEVLRVGLGPYVAKHMQDRYGANWRRHASRARGGEPGGGLDVYALLKTLLDRWHDLFRHDAKLRRARSFVSLAMDARNDTAHFTGAMETRETLRHLDAMRELLVAVGATAQAAIVERLYKTEHEARRDSSRG